MVLTVKILHTYWEKSVGLIGADPVYPVYFTTRWGIHTFGMQTAIDVLILDDHFRVIKLARNLAPNRILLWNPGYRHVIELPAGDIEKKSIHAGDQITLGESMTHHTGR